jgi:hypothetical protein
VRRSVLVVSALSILALAGAASADPFNPQPDPPGRAKSKAALNPQPLPPGRHARVDSRGHAFNPQPDPPGDKHVQHPHGSSQPPPHHPLDIGQGANA